MFNTLFKFNGIFEIENILADKFFKSTFRDPSSGKLSDDSKQKSERGNSSSLSVSGPKIRRSSVVVIPPMQVCPGDLLVYSKALTHGGNISGKVMMITTIHIR